MATLKKKTLQSKKVKTQALKPETKKTVKKKSSSKAKPLITSPKKNKKTSSLKKKATASPKKKKVLKKVSTSTQEVKDLRRIAEVVEPNTSTKHIAEVVETDTKSLVNKPLPALSDGLSFYLEAIRKYPLLSKEEEMKIAERYFEKKDPKDAEILVTSNLRFVVKVAAEYSQFGSKLIDLIQEGNVGLMHAEFNPYKGARLITYAVWWIKGYIQDYLMKQHSMVKIGTTHNQRKLFYNLEKEKAKIDQLGLEPTVALLSDRLGVTEKEVNLMENRMSSKDLSLDQPLGDDESGGSLLDFESIDETATDDLLIENETLSQLHEAIEKVRHDLNEKEVYILEKRLLSEEPLKLQEIGSEWGVSREAVRQMEARLMKKIKTQLLD